MSARKLKLRLKTTTFTHFHAVLPGLETREIGPVRTPPLDCAAPPPHQAQDRRLSGTPAEGARSLVPSVETLGYPVPSLAGLGN